MMEDDKKQEIVQSPGMFPAIPFNRMAGIVLELNAAPPGMAGFFHRSVFQLICFSTPGQDSLLIPDSLLNRSF